MTKRLVNWVTAICLGIVALCTTACDSSASAPPATVAPPAVAPSPQVAAATATTAAPAPVATVALPPVPSATAQPQPASAATPRVPAAAATPAAKAPSQKNQPVPTPVRNPDFFASEILGRPTNTSLTANVVPAREMELYYEYGGAPGSYSAQTAIVKAAANTPLETLIDKLAPDTRYYYRIRYRPTGASAFATGQEHSFVTQRAPGATFTFGIQGDSHPERAQQNNPDLYRRTLLTAAADQPDFYIAIGDDFSVDTLKTINAATVTERYTLQREFLGIVGASAPLFLVNGNHEQAALYNLNGTANNVAVWAQTARNRYYPQPAPDGFYTGDAKPVEFIGQLRDYYAWTWGDALFVVIDPYWHSTVPVDNVLGGAGAKRTDMWAITLGDEQYRWFKQTLEQSSARYKFVFTHHVLGTGRGGIEMAKEFEWGGQGRNAVWEFDKMRPGWELPIHQLMVKTGVTIFFQGHDHIFVKQELDGVIYQTLPEPGDPQYMAYNDDAYRTGVKLPSTGHVRVTVAPAQVTVDYVRSYLPKDESGGHATGEVAYSYTVAPKAR